MTRTRAIQAPTPTQATSTRTDRPSQIEFSLRASLPIYLIGGLSACAILSFALAGVLLNDEDAHERSLAEQDATRASAISLLAVMQRPPSATTAKPAVAANASSASPLFTTASVKVASQQPTKPTTAKTGAPALAPAPTKASVPQPTLAVALRPAPVIQAPAALAAAHKPAPVAVAAAPVQVHSVQNVGTAGKAGSNTPAAAPPIKQTAHEPAVEAVSAEAIAEARKLNKLEGVALADLGVLKIASTEIMLKNGSSIRIGQRFPTGERLLALDPDGAQIVTDKRTIMAF